MKKVQFIRHSMPADPYTDYSKLTFDQICDLATEKFTPDIHPNSEKLIKEKLDAAEIGKVEVIFCSNSKRTIQTAELICEVFSLDVEVIPTTLLMEVHFDPSKQMTLKEYEEKGLQLIRERLFEGMEKGKGADSIKETFVRIKELEHFLKNLSQKNVLCVTHSFYMRLLRLYLLEGITNPEIVTSDKLLHTIDHTYVEGFEFEV